MEASDPSEVLPEEDTMVPAVLQQVLALPNNIHVAVRHTATKLVTVLLCDSVTV